MTIETGKVLGRVASGWWAQVHDWDAVGEKAHLRGHLVAAASLHQPDLGEMEAVAVGREVLSRLHELYYGDLETDPLTALRQAAASLQTEFVQIELVAVSVVDAVVYAVVLGGGGIWTKVGSRQGWLVNPGRVGDGTPALSGWGQPGQVIVAGNSRFWQALSLGAVRAAVANASTATEAAEGMGTVVAGRDGGMGGVGVVIQIPSGSRRTKSQISKIEAPKTSHKIKDVLSRFVPRPVGPIFIRHTDPARSRRRNLWLGVGFLLLLLLLVGGWQWRRAYLETKQSERSQRIEETVYKFNQAQALVELNPVRSRQLLDEVQLELAQLQSDKVTKRDERVKRVEAEFGSVLGAATGVRQVAAEEVLDLGWLRQGMTGSRLALLGGDLVVLDTVANRLVLVDPVKKSGTVIAGADALGQAKLLAVYPGKMAVVGDKGIVECSLQGSCQAVISLPADVGELVDLDMFAGNIYLLTKSTLWRYQATDTGYGSAAGWLASSEDSSSLSLSSGMAIDGFIWVIRSDGQILKYARGIRENFGVTDLDKPFMPGGIVYTDAEAEKLYVLDRGNSRIVVLDKTGAYRLQYQLDQAREATDVVVDEKGGKFYLLAGPKIWAGEL